MALRKASVEPLHEVIDREHPRDLPGLLTQLRSGSDEQRRWAARDLAHHHEAALALGERLVAEGDASVREALFTSLASIGTDAAATALLPLLRCEDAFLRNGAIEALGSMPAATAPKVSALLRDADPDVRLFTVNLLCELQHERVPQWLAEVLAHEAEINVVAAAVEVLAEVGTPEHVPMLRKVVSRFPDEPFIEFAVDMAVQRIEVI